MNVVPEIAIYHDRTSSPTSISSSVSNSLSTVDPQGPVPVSSNVRIESPMNFEHESNHSLQPLPGYSVESRFASQREAESQIKSKPSTRQVRIGDITDPLSAASLNFEMKLGQIMADYLRKN